MEGGVTMNKAQLVYANIDEQGRFIEIIYGINIIPEKPYRYFFMISAAIEIPMAITLAELEQWQNDYIATLDNE